MHKQFLFIVSFLLFSVGSAQVQQQNQSRLTIETIMQDPAVWPGTSPDRIFWSENGQAIYFSWNPERDTLPSLYAYELKQKEIKRLSLDEEKALPAEKGVYDQKRQRKVYARGGNIYLYDVGRQTERVLVQGLEAVSDPVFIKNETEVAFRDGNTVYALRLEDGMLRVLVRFKAQVDSKIKQKQTEQAKWLERQQEELFEVLQRRKQVETTEKYRDAMKKVAGPLVVPIGNKRLTGVSVAPSGRYLIYSLWAPGEGIQTLVPHFVSRSGYTEPQYARPKVGSPQGSLEMGIVDLEEQVVQEVKTGGIPGLKDVPDYWVDYPERMPKVGEEILDRRVNLLGPLWNEVEDYAVVVALSHDNKDRWILLLDPVSGKLDLLDRQRDEAWISGPGIEGWSASAGDLGWMPDKESLWFQSEESGYSHLYAVNIHSKEKVALTSGEFEVSDAFISKNKKYFYFTANKVHPGVRHFYRMPVWGGEMQQITSMEGGNEVVLSPDEKFLAIRHSTGNRPWELYLQENKPGAEARCLTHSTSPEFDTYPWRMPEYVTFEARDGAVVHARLYRPEKPESQGPAVIFVHGAGYLQNAHKWWSSYFREYQFHNFLADNGYTVLDIDYRGSAGYGRDWRTAIYRHMGGKDLTDQVDGARFLVENCDVSPDRIGIYGGSYGGFITLMALFKYPKVFKAGAALRAVTDWAHYNHGYTSNILNTPQEDSIAFVRSSPIYYADGLEGALLMCHGMVDDNVQFQDIVRLTQRLIELGKENWELAVYPVERHGFVEPSSWIDEYKRIYKLFEENLK